MILFGHVGGVPVEEMLSAAPAAAAAALLMARECMHRVRRMRRPGG